MRFRRTRVAAIGAATLTAALVVTSTALAHASLSPPVGTDEHAAVLHAGRADREGQRDHDLDPLTVPSGVAMDSFQPSPGWKRSQQSTGSGESAIVNTVTWTGGSVPTQEDAVFGFAATLTGGSDLHVRGAPDVLGRLGGGVERAGELGHAQPGDRGRVVDRRRR